MSEPLRTSELAAIGGISRSYASEILSGKRAPSRDLALSIFHLTGRKFGPIADLDDKDVAILARIEAKAEARRQPTSTKQDQAA